MEQAPTPFSCISPADYRYWNKRLKPYLSEDAFTSYKLKVEVALAAALWQKGVCSEAAAQEIAKASEAVTTDEVYEEEENTKHDIRALVNCIARRVSAEAKPFIHLGATSYDIIDTANACRYRDAVRFVFLPYLLDLETVLLDMVERDAKTLQIGRTHGKHAVPLTFGFALAEYPSRLGSSILSLFDLASKLPAKFSGAVGAYNASSLFFEDPVEFEAMVLGQLGIRALDHSTQIVQPEPLVRFFSEIIIASGIMANLADDMRNLQRTEIGEVGEEFEEGQVGSSTMPQKRNPWNFENIKSMWKDVMPRMVTIYMNQISEHQRDLTNSASSRTLGEIILYVGEMTKRMKRIMSKLKVDKENLAANLERSKGMIMAEPTYLLLASLGHPEAHEAVKQLTLEAERERLPLLDVFDAHPEFDEYRERFTEKQDHLLRNPADYIGIAPERALAVVAGWRDEVARIKADLAR